MRKEIAISLAFLLLSPTFVQLAEAITLKVEQIGPETMLFELTIRVNVTRACEEIAERKVEAMTPEEVEREAREVILGLVEKWREDNETAALLAYSNRSDELRKLLTKEGINVTAYAQAKEVGKRLPKLLHGFEAKLSELLRARQAKLLELMRRVNATKAQIYSKMKELRGWFENRSHDLNMSFFRKMMSREEWEKRFAELRKWYEGNVSELKAELTAVEKEAEANRTMIEAWHDRERSHIVTERERLLTTIRTFRVERFGEELKARPKVKLAVERVISRHKFFNDTFQHMARRHLVLSNWLNETYERYHENVIEVSKSVNASFRGIGLGVRNFTFRMVKIVKDGKIYIEIHKSFVVTKAITRNATGIFFNCKFRYLNFSVPAEVEGVTIIPAKHLFLDLSAFDVPLERWESRYDPATNRTSFVLRIKEIRIEQPYGSVSIDPEATIVVEGYAAAKGDTISVKPVPLLERPTTIVGVTLPLWSWIAFLVVTAVVACAAALVARKLVSS